MNKQESLKNFIEQEWGDILKQRFSPEELLAIMIGIDMVLEEVGEGKLDNVYDAIELSASLSKKNAEVLKLQEELLNVYKIVNSNYDPPTLWVNKD